MTTEKLELLAKLVEPRDIGSIVSDPYNEQEIKLTRLRLSELEKKGYVTLLTEIRNPYDMRPLWLDIIRGSVFVATKEPTAEDYVRANGFTIPSTSIVLAADDSDVDQFTRLLTLLVAALNSGAMSPTAVVKIKAMNKDVHEFPASQMVTILLQYGSWLKTVWDNSL